jgi:hypothetical protein
LWTSKTTQKAGVSDGILLAAASVLPLLTVSVAVAVTIAVTITTVSFAAAFS